MSDVKITLARGRARRAARPARAGRRREGADAEPARRDPRLRRAAPRASTPTGVEPTAHAVPLVNVMRDDEARPSYPVETRCSRTRPTRRTASSACRGSSRSEPVTDWTGLTIHESVRALRRRPGHGPGAGRCLPRPHRARSTTTLGAFLTVAPGQARAQAERGGRAAPARRRRAAARRRAGRDQGRPLHPGHPHDLRLADPRATSCRPYDATVVARLTGGGRGRPRQDQHGRVRDGLVHRELRLLHRPATRGTSTASPAARRAAPPRRWPPTWPPAASAPTPAARSASPPPSAASSGSSRPTAASPATA